MLKVWCDKCLNGGGEDAKERGCFNIIRPREEGESACDGHDVAKVKGKAFRPWFPGVVDIRNKVADDDAREA